MERYDVIVVGAGVVGSATAFALARAGASVCLVERDAVAVHASQAAAGMLAPFAESEGEGAAFELGERSLALLPGLVAEVRELSGIDPLLRQTGLLRVGFPDEIGTLRARAAALRAQGCEFLDTDELRKREPRLDPRLAGGIWSPREGHVESALLTRAFAAAAVRRGARLREGCEVLGLERDGERVVGVHTADTVLSAADVVLCMGAWAAAAERWLDVRLPVEPVKGQMIALRSPLPALSSIIWGAPAYLVPRADGSVAVGATVEHAGFDAEPTAEGVAGLVQAARTIIPELAHCAFRGAWAGVRPGSPDGLPLVGPLPGAPGLMLAVGHYRNGVLLCALTALAVADWLLEGRRWAELGALAPERFQS